LGQDGVPPELAVRDGEEAAGRGSVPSYASPENAAAALARAVGYAAWRARPVGEVPAFDVDPVDLSGLPHDGTWLPDSGAVLSAYQLFPWPTRRAENPSTAWDLANQLGWPVALKSPDDAWRNRVDVGAVRLAVGPEDLEEAWAALQELRGRTDLLVQPV